MIRLGAWSIVIALFFTLAGAGLNFAADVESPNSNGAEIDDINVTVEAKDQLLARKNLETYLKGRNQPYNDADVYPEVHLCTKIPGTPLKERCCRTPQGDNCTLRVLNQ